MALKAKIDNPDRYIDVVLMKFVELASENSEEKAKKAVEKNATENKKEEGGGN